MLSRFPYAGQQYILVRILTIDWEKKKKKKKKKKTNQLRHTRLTQSYSDNVVYFKTAYLLVFFINTRHKLVSQILLCLISAVGLNLYIIIIYKQVCGLFIVRFICFRRKSSADNRSIYPIFGSI